MNHMGGKEIRIRRVPRLGPNANGFDWDWVASISLGHFAWTATGYAKTKQEAKEQAEAFISEIKAEGWQ